MRIEGLLFQELVFFINGGMNKMIILKKELKNYY